MIINGVWYERDKIVSLETTARVFKEEAPSVGNCCSRTISLEILAPSVKIPVGSEIWLYARVANNAGQYSEWIHKGQFWVDTRKTNLVSSGQKTTMELTGYDAMMRAEQDFVTGAENTWPKTDKQVLRMVCNQIGVVCTDAFAASFNIPYTEDLICREVLGYIGAMHGGSWIMSDDGFLKFIKLGRNGGSVPIIPQGIAIGDPVDQITSVKLHKMDGTSYDGSTGVETGRRLNVDCPWATEAMAQRIIEQVAWYQYQPFSIDKSWVDPRIEIGDRIDWTDKPDMDHHDGAEIPWIIYELKTTCGNVEISEIGAPAEEESTRDYKYKSGPGGSAGGFSSRSSANQQKSNSDKKTLVASVGTVAAGLQAQADNLRDANWLHANTRIFASADGVASALDLWVQGQPGNLQSGASLVADVVAIHGKTNIFGLLTITSDGAGLSVSGPIYAQNQTISGGTLKGASVSASQNFIFKDHYYTAEPVTFANGTFTIMKQGPTSSD